MAEARAEFHETLSTRLLDHVRTSETPFEEPVTGQPTDSCSADIHLPDPHGCDAVVETVCDTVYPRERAVVGRARAHATELDAECFATCNSNDLFLFHDRGESDGDDVDVYYLDLRADQLEDAITEFLDAVRYVHERGELPSQPERERLVGLLRSFHSSVWPTYETLAAETYSRDEPFTRAFDEWVRTNDYADRPEDEQFELAAKQYAYLRSTEVLLSGVDNQPVFEQDGDLFDVFPRSDRTERMLEEFATDVESQHVARLDEDLLGAVYEEFVPADERQALGQFYTHPKIAETLCRWTIRPSDGTDRPRVLDPAAGSGTFVVEAYKRLAELDAGASHRALVDSITAIDVNRFPLHLTALNLSSQHVQAETDDLRIHHDSFFDVDSETLRLVDAARDGPAAGGAFDAVVGNPPYIRQENLHPDTEHFRAHLDALGRSGAAPYGDGAKRLSRRSDAYIYFVTHATQFLRDGGRLGFVLPTKWLTTRYGESFQEFLYDHYRVEGVVGFSARAFEDALVDTALLLAERCEDERERRATTTDFVRITEPMAADAIVDTLSFGDAMPDDAYMTVRNRPAYRAVAVDQDYLVEAGGRKLSPYLRAPVEFIRLVDHPLFTELGDLGETHRGVMTGANEFFFLDDEDLETWNLPEEFLLPAIKGIRDADDQVVRAAESAWYLFDVHDYVAAVGRDVDGDAPGSELESRVKNALSRDGYDEVRRYVEWGEAEGFHERRSCASRPVWFDLGALEPPEILHPKFFDERVFVIWNPDGLMPSNAVDCVSLDDGVDEAALMGVLNSTVNRAMLECWGRAEGGGALQLMTYEVDSLPVLDVRELDARTRGRIAERNERLVAGADGAQTALDRAVLDALDSELSVKRLQELQAGMLERRVASGEAVRVLVERPEETRAFQTFQRDSGPASSR